jgi:hypothetical protein
MPRDERRSLTSTVNYQVGGQPTQVVAADFNGDSTPDLAVSEGTVRVLVGNGNGTFRVLNGGYIAGGFLAAADLNRDGWTDLVSADRGSDSVSVLLNDQNWGMAPRPPSHGGHSGGLASAPPAAELLSDPGDFGVPGQVVGAAPVLPPDRGLTQALVSPPGAGDSVAVLAALHRHTHQHGLFALVEEPFPEDGLAELAD